MESSKPSFSIVLIAPEIPGNTGSIGRTCLSLNAQLILIKPYGFDLSEKAVRRAGLDYWKYINIKEYESFDEFLKIERPHSNSLFFIDNNLDGITPKSYFNAEFSKNCFVVFGSETKGIPLKVAKKYSSQIFELPNFSTKIRSLNLSNAVCAVAFEVIRKIALLP